MFLQFLLSKDRTCSVFNVDETGFEKKPQKIKKRILQKKFENIATGYM